MVREDRGWRKLTTILAADLAGFSRLIGGAEEQTLPLLHVCREVTDGLIATHGGRVFGSAGDSVMAEFASPVEAVRCGIEIQQTLKRREAHAPALSRMHFRIGIHLGDVVVEDGVLNGDAVNVAARLEGKAEPGGSDLRGSPSQGPQDGERRLRESRHASAEEHHRARQGLPRRPAGRWPTRRSSSLPSRPSRSTGSAR